MPIGDVITEIEDDPVSSSEDVIEVVNSVKPGERLLLTVVTPGEKERRVESHGRYQAGRGVGVSDDGPKREAANAAVRTLRRERYGGGAWERARRPRSRCAGSESSWLRGN